jgi:hypothetical protein
MSRLLNLVWLGTHGKKCQAKFRSINAFFLHFIHVIYSFRLHSCVTMMMFKTVARCPSGEVH